MRDIFVQLVGVLTVHHDGRAHTGREVGDRKARMLLALLAVERGRLVAMDRIVELLWCGKPPRDPAANVATLVSRVRATFGRDVVVGGRCFGYRLSDEVRTDLGNATAMLAEAETRLAAGEPSRALAAATGALDLLGGARHPHAAGAVTDAYVLVDQPHSPYAEEARALQLDLLRRARHAVANAALRTGDHAVAAAAAEAVAAADPLDEAACRVLMRAYAAAGEPGRALLAYERLRTTLATELGCDPAGATQELHVATLRTPAPPTPQRGTAQRSAVQRSTPAHRLSPARVGCPS